MIKPSKINFSAAARGCCTGLMTIKVKKLPVNSPHSGYASPCWRVMPDTRCTVQPGKYDRSRRRASAGRRLCTSERGVDDGHTALRALAPHNTKNSTKNNKIKWNPPLPGEQAIICPCMGHPSTPTIHTRGADTTNVFKCHSSVCATVVRFSSGGVLF